MTYDDMPPVYMTRSELLALEDRSNFIGRDRVPGCSFRCNWNFCGGEPRWVVGTFVANPQKRQEYDELLQFCRESGQPGHEDDETLFVELSHDVVFCRVVFTDGAPPPHTISELLRLLVRAGDAKSRL